MRPSFHWASAWPCSAAYCSDVTAFAFSPARSASVPERNASTGLRIGARPAPAGAAEGTETGGRGMSRRPAGPAVTGVARVGTALEGGIRSIPGAAAEGVTRSTPTATLSLGVPSRARAGARPRARPTTATHTSPSDVRITLLFRRPTRVRHGACNRRTHLLGVFPQVTRCEFSLRRLPLSPAAGQFLVRDPETQRPGPGI